MRTIRILQQTIVPLLASIHKKRLESLFWAVSSVIRGNRLSLTAIGRAHRNVRGGSYGVKHSIKRSDRILGNRKLHREIPLFFYAISQILIGSKKRPVILVDWTEAGLNHVALVAALPTDGRALTVYAEVHPVKKNGNAAVQKVFLRKLRTVMPTGCSPIIVTDAGFKTPWFKLVDAMGWDFVGRVRGTCFTRPIKGTKWRHIKDLFKQAVFKATDLGQWVISKYNPMWLRLVVIRKKRIKTTIHGTTRARKGRNRAMEPWLLATSLNEQTAKTIVDIYAMRMQIEETFRDAKNHRFGWSFEDAHSTTCERILVLLLIATLGMLALTLLGQAAESRNHHLSYQANRIHRRRRVLSLYFLGKNIIQAGDEYRYTTADLWLSLEQILLKLPVLEKDFASDLVGIP